MNKRTKGAANRTANPKSLKQALASINAPLPKPLTPANAPLDLELEKAVGHIGAFDRLMLAEKFGLWAVQLTASAREMVKPFGGKSELPLLEEVQLRMN